MGYDPFKPLMSNTVGEGGSLVSSAQSQSPRSPVAPSNNNRSPALSDNTSSSSVSAVNNNSSQDVAGSSPAFYDVDADDEVMVCAAVDEAFAVLMSISEVDGEQVNTCTSTAMKMLSNLSKNKNEAKFR
jgi:hypothetical protein